MDSDKTDYLDDDNRRQEWNTRTLQEDYAVIVFEAPLVVVRRRSDHLLGTLQFDHHPRVYYNFKPLPEV